MLYVEWPAGSRPAAAQHQHNHTTRLGLNFELLNFDWNMAASWMAASLAGKLWQEWQPGLANIATTATIHCLSCLSHPVAAQIWSHNTLVRTFLKIDNKSILFSILKSAKKKVFSMDKLFDIYHSICIVLSYALL